ncbi:RAB6A-GEF complex partner protein 2-like [Mercenaria mercenaria]|uniref:RAB6A-GEF complex partner protein 2-like n=1 Tax=Mercenaria mercenaria TaxID=6596 RepID=UPI00234F9FE7|nr:RAB6A-GEF complex partner protein 2-like [Mercenaria mercenaria]
MPNSRIGSHDLEIETGRHRKIERENRLCRKCNKNIIEDEFHFLLCCEFYSELRMMNGPDSLSWASAQIHCQCSVSESRVFLPRTDQLSTEEVSTSGCDTSFVPSKGERGMTVLTTKPKILFCDMRLDPGQSKTCKSC